MDDGNAVDSIRVILENEFKRNKKVAVITDEWLIRYDIIKYLSNEGFQVTVTSSPDIRMIVY